MVGGKLGTLGQEMCTGDGKPSTNSFATAVQFRKFKMVPFKNGDSIFFN